ncbi:hypothetical protein BH10ACI3_BH10ACI3_22950 [soil metagenome]
MSQKSTPNRLMLLVLATLYAVVFIFAAHTDLAAQPASDTYEIGDKIEVRWAGDEMWYKAKITAINDGFYTIIYEQDGNNARYKPDRMRPLEGAGPRRATTAPAAVPKLVPPPVAAHDAKYKPGDRVECDKASIGSWEKGTVMPFIKYDDTGGDHYRVRLDAQARGGMYLEGLLCKTENIRPIGGPVYNPAATAISVGPVTVDEENTLSADRPILTCPVDQSPVKNGARPNPELFKKIIRCRKGEKAASTGYDGAVTVDVTALVIGTSRPWIYSQDIGGKPGVTIVPVKATFHYKTFYRSSTQVSQNWIRTLNFYVNEFGEWTIGSEVSIKTGETVNIPRDK